MHAILVGRKIYALDMPSNFIFTHRQWLAETARPPPISCLVLFCSSRPHFVSRYCVTPNLEDQMWTLIGLNKVK